MTNRMFRLMMPVTAVLLLTACMSAGPAARKADPKAAAIENMKLGTEYMRRGQLRDAKEKLDAALKYDQSNGEANWAMAMLLEQLDRAPESDRYYKTAMKQLPDNPDIANTYAVYLCKSGKSEEALPLFDGLMRNRLYREPWAAATNAAVCLRADKRSADALAYVDRALTMRADYVDAVIEKADLQIDLGRGSQSRLTIENYLAVPRAKEADPRRPDVLLVGVRAALAENNRSAADNFARLLRRDFPSSPQTAALPQLLQGTK